MKREYIVKTVATYSLETFLNEASECYPEYRIFQILSCGNEIVVILKLIQY